MAEKQKDVKDLLVTFEQEISRLDTKKHKTEDDLEQLNLSIKSLEKQEAEIHKRLKSLMDRGTVMGTRRVKIKDRLSTQSSKLEKLRMLYKDLKEV